MSVTLSDVAAVRQQVDTLLGTFFARHTQAATTIHPDYGRLWSSMERLFHAEGKRLRPEMLILGYEAFGGRRTGSIVPIAAAHELLHLSLLIHDDIIDRDLIRYGVANVTSQYKDAYAPLVARAEDGLHYAESAALLGGDLLISAAHQLILESAVADHLKIIAYRQLGEAIFEVAGGELLDTEASFRGSAAADPETIARYKTIGYSFIAPLLTGAHLAEAPEEALELVKSFAVAVGMGFQLSDDLLGVFGDEAVTGKSAASDIREGKRTLLVLLALDRMSPAQRRNFEATLGNSNATDSQVEAVRRLLVDTGAQQAVAEQVDAYAQKARQILDRFPVQPEAHQRFCELIERATKRSF